MYGKLFQSTFTGSMAGAGADVFAVWSWVIANTRESRVEINATILAATIGMTKESVTNAIAYLCAPDPSSRSSDHEGRRMIQEGQFQFFVPNHARYREIRNEDERREYNRIKQAERRARLKCHAASNEMSLTVNDKSAVSAQSEAEAEAEAEAEKKTNTVFPSGNGAHKNGTSYSDDFCKFWDAFPAGRKKSKGGAWKAWQSSVVKAGVDVALVLAKAAEYARSDEGEGEYVKMPSTWLNQCCWEDDPESWRVKVDKRSQRLGPGQKYDPTSAATFGEGF